MLYGRNKCSLHSSVLALLFKSSFKLIRETWKNIFVLALPRSSSFLYPGHTSLTVHLWVSWMDGVPISNVSQKWLIAYSYLLLKVHSLSTSTKVL